MTRQIFRIPKPGVLTPVYDDDYTFIQQLPNGTPKVVNPSPVEKHYSIPIPPVDQPTRHYPPPLPTPKKPSKVKEFFSTVFFCFLITVCGYLTFTHLMKNNEYKNIKYIAAKLESELQKSEYDDSLRSSMSLFNTLQTERRDTIKLKPRAPAAVSSTQDSTKDTDIKTIISVKSRYMRGQRVNGQILVKTGGSDSWRNNNPGSILYSDFAKNEGAIEKNDKMAIFPSEEVGHSAFRNMLFSTKKYIQLTITQAMEEFAPKKEGFNPDLYIKDIKELGISTDTKMIDTSANEKDLILNAIKKREGYLTGRNWVYKDIDDWNKRGY